MSALLTSLPPELLERVLDVLAGRLEWPTLGCNSAGWQLALTSRVMMTIYRAWLSQLGDLRWMPRLKLRLGCHLVDKDMTALNEPLKQPQLLVQLNLQYLHLNNASLVSLARGLRVTCNLDALDLSYNLGLTDFDPVLDVLAAPLDMPEWRASDAPKGERVPCHASLARLTPSPMMPGALPDNPALYPIRPAFLPVLRGGIDWKYTGLSAYAASLDVTYCCDGGGGSRGEMPRMNRQRRRTCTGDPSPPPVEGDDWPDGCSWCGSQWEDEDLWGVTGPWDEP